MLGYWYEGGDAKRLNKLIKKASSVIGQDLVPLAVVEKKRRVHTLLSIMENSTHPLKDLLLALRSSFSWRLILPRCISEWYRRSFVPTAVRLYNTSLFDLLGFSFYKNKFYCVPVLSVSLVEHFGLYTRGCLSTD